MRKNAKGKTSYGLKIVGITDPIIGLAYEFEEVEHEPDEFEFRLRHYFLNECATYEWEDLETITSDEMLKLIWNGQNPFEWLVKKAKMLKPSYKIHIDGTLYKELLGELALYEEYLEYERQMELISNF